MKWLVLGNDQICKLVTIQKIENDLESPKPIIIIVFNTKNIEYSDNLYFVYDFPILKEITKRDDDFANWYTDVVKKAELVDYASTRGCMIIRPYGYAIWENIQKDLNGLLVYIS